jgi:hypothetical protein
MLGPALAPLVPWQPLQVLEIIAAEVGPAAHSDELTASPPASKARFNSLSFIAPPFIGLFIKPTTQPLKIPYSKAF